MNNEHVVPAPRVTHEMRIIFDVERLENGTFHMRMSNVETGEIMEMSSENVGKMMRRLSGYGIDQVEYFMTDRYEKEQERRRYQRQEKRYADDARDCAKLAIKYHRLGLTEDAQAHLTKCFQYVEWATNARAEWVSKDEVEGRKVHGNAQRACKWYHKACNILGGFIA